MDRFSVYFAQAYGSGSYDGCNYNSSTSCSGSSSGGSSSGGNLTNTGFLIAVIVTIACLLVFLALIVKLWKRPSKKRLSSQAAADSNNSQKLNTY